MVTELGLGFDDDEEEEEEEEEEELLSLRFSKSNE